MEFCFFLTILWTQAPNHVLAFSWPLPSQVSYFPAGRNIAFHVSKAYVLQYRRLQTTSLPDQLCSYRRGKKLFRWHPQCVLMLKTVCVPVDKPEFLFPTTPRPISGVNCTFHSKNPASQETPPSPPIMSTQSHQV